jgi:hypothetical protein
VMLARGAATDACYVSDAWIPLAAWSKTKHQIEKQH